MEQVGRRHFLRGAMALSAGAVAGVVPYARGLAQPVAPVQIAMTAGLLPLALSALHKSEHRVSARRLIGIADFSVPSALPRFHIVNVENGTSEALLVAHGKGSDPEHSGLLQQFSNVPGSEASSSGAYLVGESYIGKYGLSRRLIGLDPENDMAEARAIVIHPAWYVSETLAREQGKVGRSQGCLAFADADIGKVLWQLPPGSLIYAGKI